jgi:molybdate transport system regulatory protein
MSYRRAWLLIDDMNRCFREPVVSAQTGGSRGGGAVLTQFGRKLVRDFRAIETDAMVVARSRLRNLTASLRHSARASSDKVRRLPVRRAAKR